MRQPPPLLIPKKVWAYCGVLAILVMVYLISLVPLSPSAPAAWRAHNSLNTALLASCAILIKTAIVLTLRRQPFARWLVLVALVAHASNVAYFHGQLMLENGRVDGSEGLRVVLLLLLLGIPALVLIAVPFTTPFSSYYRRA